MTYQELLKKAIEDTGMTQKAFAEYFGIPVRTLQDWLAGKRKMPDYLLRLMIYKLEIENMVEGLSEELEDQCTKGQVVTMKKRLSIIMTMIMLVVAFTMIPMQCVEAKGKVKLSTTKKTLQIGKTYTITLKNAKNVKWKSGNKAIVKVKLADGTILRADVRLHALRDVLIDQKFKEFKDTYITSNMTDEEKIAKVAWYAGAFSDYEAGQPGWMDLLLRGKGDCMASRLLVARMCVDLGMKAYGCSAEYHGETIVHAGDTYYLVTTGFKEPRPRSYVVAKIETDDIEAYCKGKGVPWVVVK